MHRASSLELMRGRFTAFEELAEAAHGWKFDFHQLDAGRSPSGLLRLASRTTQLQRLRLGRHYDQRGETPAGMVTFGLIESGDQGVRWRGRDFSAGEIFVTAPATEFEGLSFPGFGGFTLAVSEERLEEVTATLGVSEAGWRNDPDGQPRILDPRAVHAFRSRLGWIVDQLESDPMALGAAALEHELAFEIPAQLIETLASASEAAEVAPSSVRDLAVRRAIQFLEEQADSAPTVRAVCEAARVSWRTLDYAFREHFAVTPRAYMKALRLNRVRRDLLDGGPDARIADVANRWGFWHMGQLAADYRRLFDELPSDTLGLR